MAVDVNLETISSGYNISKINTNFQAIDFALQDSLSRSGGSPNQMNADLDMNSNDILNVDNIDVNNLIIGGIPVTANDLEVDPKALVPIGGSDGQVLTKQSSLDYDATWEDVPEGIPPGGADGQVLTKQSAVDFDVNWETPAATGITGTVGTTDNAIPRADGTGGSTLQGSTITIDDAGAMLIPQNSANTTAPQFTIQQSGTGDAIMQWLLPSNRAWIAGIDNSDSDSFKVSPANDSFAAPVLRISTDGNVSELARITLDKAPVFDLAAGALATQLLISIGTSPTAVASKTYSVIRISETGGGNLIFDATGTSTVSGLYSSVEASSLSVTSSDVYGAVLHAINGGAGTTRGLHAGGFGSGTSTGVLNGIGAQIQPVATQGTTSGVFVSLTSTGIHDKAFGVLVESNNGDRYNVAYGNAIFPLPINQSFFRAWMATGSSTNARAFQLLDNGSSEIAYISKTGDYVGPTVNGTTSLISASPTNGITITQAAITRNNAAGSMTLAAGSNAGNTFAINTGGSQRLGVSDTATTSTGYLHSAITSAVPANGNVNVGIRISSTTNLGVYVGSGPPTGLSAGKGSLYTNTTATTTTTRLYVNTDGGTTWANFTASA